jgi:hypothetical protein
MKNSAFLVNTENKLKYRILREFLLITRGLKYAVVWSLGPWDCIPFGVWRCGRVFPCYVVLYTHGHCYGPIPLPRSPAKCLKRFKVSELHLNRVAHRVYSVIKQTNCFIPIQISGPSAVLPTQLFSGGLCFEYSISDTIPFHMFLVCPAIDLWSEILLVMLLIFSILFLSLLVFIKLSLCFN